MCGPIYSCIYKLSSQKKQNEKKAAEASSANQKSLASPGVDTSIVKKEEDISAIVIKEEDVSDVQTPTVINTDRRTNCSILDLLLGVTPTPAPNNVPSINFHMSHTLPSTNFSIACAFQTTSRTAVRSDQFAVEFCEWYFKMVNRLQPQCSHFIGDTFNQEIFFHNSSVDVYLIGSATCERHGQGQATVFQMLRDTFAEFKLLFSPNLSSGIQAHKSSHGIVIIFCCGMLHCGNSCVGIFEQEAGLARSPVDGSWKIMYIKLNLKQSDVQPVLPTLTPCQVFDIE